MPPPPICTARRFQFAGSATPVEDPDDIIESVLVVTRRRHKGKTEKVKFLLEARLPSPRR
jgi:hypothetical protein